MTRMIKHLALLALAAAIAAPSAANAASIRILKLPMLVDKYYELKHPAGPVTRKVPEVLQKGVIFYQLYPDMKDFPMPHWNMDRVLIGL